MTEASAPLLPGKAATLGLGTPPLSPRKQHQIGTAALAALIFFSVSGGPFGMEEAILAAGPLVTMIGLAVLPVLWSVPEGKPFPVSLSAALHPCTIMIIQTRGLHCSPTPPLPKHSTQP